MGNRWPCNAFATVGFGLWFLLSHNGWIRTFIAMRCTQVACHLPRWPCRSRTRVAYHLMHWCHCSSTQVACHLMRWLCCSRDTNGKPSDTLVLLPLNSSVQSDSLALLLSHMKCLLSDGSALLLPPRRCVPVFSIKLHSKFRYGRKTKKTSHSVFF